MAKLARDIKKTLLLKFTLLFILWYVCVHSVDRHKPKHAETTKHFLSINIPPVSINKEKK